MAREIVRKPFTKWSRITPAEGAMMLDVPNIIMINSDGEPAPYSADAYGYAESFYRMQKVVWSVTGSCGFRSGNEEEFIYCLRARPDKFSVVAVWDVFYDAYRNNKPYPITPDQAAEVVRVIEQAKIGTVFE